MTALTPPITTAPERVGWRHLSWHRVKIVARSDLRQLIVRVDPDQEGIGSRITATVP